MYDNDDISYVQLYANNYFYTGDIIFGEYIQINIYMVILM